MKCLHFFLHLLFCLFVCTGGHKHTRIINCPIQLSILLVETNGKTPRGKELNFPFQITHSKMSISIQLPLIPMQEFTKIWSTFLTAKQNEDFQNFKNTLEWWAKRRILVVLWRIGCLVVVVVVAMKTLGTSTNISFGSKWFAMQTTRVHGPSLSWHHHRRRSPVLVVFSWVSSWSIPANGCTELGWCTQDTLSFSHYPLALPSSWEWPHHLCPEENRPENGEQFQMEHNSSILENKLAAHCYPSFGMGELALAPTCTHSREPEDGRQERVHSHFARVPYGSMRWWKGHCLVSDARSLGSLVFW